jgi:hypothetical protein
MLSWVSSAILFTENLLAKPAGLYAGSAILLQKGLPSNLKSLVKVQ